jgi:hypothetical protein
MTNNNNNDDDGGFTFDFIMPTENEEEVNAQEGGGKNKAASSSSSSRRRGEGGRGGRDATAAATRERRRERPSGCCSSVFAWIDPNLLQEILTQQLYKLYQTGQLMHDDIPFPTAAAAAPAAAAMSQAMISKESPFSSLRCIRGSSLVLQHHHDDETVNDNLNNKDDEDIQQKKKDQRRQQQQQQQETDLIAGVYEGGLTVWECSLDLVRFLHTTNSVLTDSITAVAPQGRLSVLELGCGHGLPTCFLLKRFYEESQRKVINDNDTAQQQPAQSTFLPLEPCKASCHDDKSMHHHVVLSDYNDYVLKDVTLANLFLNIVVVPQRAPSVMAPEGGGQAATAATEAAALDWLHHLLATSQVQLGAGDWMGLSDQLLRKKHGQDGDDDDDNKNNNNNNNNNKQQDIEEEVEEEEEEVYTKFNVILASETLYTLQSAAETCLLLLRHLQRNTGRAYIATKRYYFGLGGGVDAFQQHVTLYNNNNKKKKNENNNGSCSNMNMFMQVTTLQVHDNGAGNIRELLQVQILCK